MNAAADSATVQYQRGVGSSLTTADQTGQALGADATQQESDVSGDFCESELHSPLSEISSVTSEKNNSDASESFRYTSDKADNLMDIDMAPSTKSPCPQEEQSYEDPEGRSPGHRTNERDEERQKSSATHKPRGSSTRSVSGDRDDASTASNENDPKQMVDIVGDASSPGEFFDQAFEFMERRRKREHASWQYNELHKSRSPHLENDMPPSKHPKASAPPLDGISPIYGGMRHVECVGRHPYYAEENRGLKSEPPRRRVSTKADYGNGKPFHAPDYQVQRRQGSLLPPLTQDQKFFVEAFKREVANAAEHAAETSALRVLGILEASGIYFGRSPFKQDRYEPSGADRKHLPTRDDFEERKMSIEMSSSPLDSKRSTAKRIKENDSSRLLSTTRVFEDGHVKTPGQSQLSFESVRTGSEAKFKSDLPIDTIDLTLGRSRGSSTGPNDKSTKTTTAKRNEPPMAGEQTHALSLVTGSGRSDDAQTDNAPVSSAGGIPRDVPKSAAVSVAPAALLDPLVRRSFPKNPFASPLHGLPIPSSFGAHMDYATSPLVEFLPGMHPDFTGKRPPGRREERVSDRLLDFPSLSAATGANPFKSKSSLKSRVSPAYRNENSDSPRRDEKTRHDQSLPTSFGLHGMPNSSAFRRHDSQKSPSSTGIRSLRRNGSPDRKPFHAPNPLSMMYPFPALPLFPGVHHSPQFAAAMLANMSQRSHGGRTDFGDLRNGPTSVPPSERISMHQSLRGHTTSFMSDHLGYDVDGSNFAFSTNGMQEGLTPQHLKKAKLIFFYTRYPNANTLKSCFPDVKFTRAITSQLIKWFSNFREFFYIQMEKFARQAVTDGVADASVLRVTRDSELFRVLNQHYNKCNEFNVPESFIKSAESSQREFFNAVRAGKDSDPAWKKVIYKIICKLDSEIPELFKSPNVLERLHEIRE